ncbi:MAG: SAM-dependent methyltransferase [Acidobacteria bacterium]|nr:SAM-dependent methyltransferase [Acidobacteriota bacterium]
MENIREFIRSLSESLHNETFVKMTLGNYKGGDEQLQKILVRLLKTKKGLRLFFLYRYDTRDTAKNYDFDQGIRILNRILGTDFFSGHLFTTKNDFQLSIGKKGRSRLNRGKPTFTVPPDLAHDRRKTIHVDPNSFYLRALGITNDQGVVRAKQEDKWNQINKFVETLGSLFDGSGLKNQKTIDVVDMGSGKGYLTFAAYDFFANTRGIEAKVIGVDTKRELVDLCNDIARSADFNGLSFEPGRIEEFDLPSTDILIALHACDTATDDAIFKGINAKAKLILVAPCCHREIRPQIKPPSVFQGILKHGILMEREAESLTDGLRSMFLEKYGYSTKVFEFISTEHTPKNNMIAGKYSGPPSNPAAITAEISEIKEFYGIDQFRLEELIGRIKIS